jgi:adenylate kinase family enzyme
MLFVNAQSNTGARAVALSDRSRIAILGVSGSGKSTLARRLAQRYGVEHIELDSLFMNAGWVETELPEFRARVARRLSGLPGYVIDGNYKKVRDLTWDRCDTIIWLNYSKPLVMRRVILRTIKRVVTHQKLWNGNRESFRKSFLSKDSIILWSWNTYERRKSECRELQRQYEGKGIRFIVIDSPKAIGQAFGLDCVEDLAAQATSTSPDPADSRAPIHAPTER